jgi:NADH:ubiquinone oxidoreductase subunit 2 (subunit N)
MFDRDSAPAEPLHRPARALTSATVLATALAVLVAGIVPGPLFDLAQTASRSLIGG